MIVDKLLEDIADYVIKPPDFSEEAYQTARLALYDSLGCGILALNFPECVKRLGPFVPGMDYPGGCLVPGTEFNLDPIQAAFNIGTQIRWLDFNDTWLGKEWGHPSDNLGGLLAITQFLKKTTIRTLLKSMIQAYEIQGVISLSNSFNKVGFDHVILVKIATAAVCTHLLGGSKVQILNAVSNAFADAGPLRTYRHFPNTGPRKSWAAGDQTSRGVFIAFQALKGEPGYATVLSTPQWGLNDVLFKNQPLNLSQPLQAYVMEHILFKIAFPAEFHAQTAVEAAFELHEFVKDKLAQIDKIFIETHESALRIITKSGPLKNPADRDHCIQYMTACGLLFGNLIAEYYEDSTASNPWIDELRNKMVVVENKQFSLDYLDPQKRSIANAVQVYFKDGSFTPKVIQEYPLGHKRRRTEAVPLLIDKFVTNIRSHKRLEANIPHLLRLLEHPDELDNLLVIDLLKFL